MFDVTVNVAVGEQADEVHRLSAFADAAHELLPLVAFEDLAAVDRHLNALGPLIEDPTRTKGVVTDLAVAHVVVARQTDSGAVRTKARRQGNPGEPVERRGPSKPNRVALVGGAAANPVHDDDEHRTGDSWERRMLFELPIGHGAFLAQSLRCSTARKQGMLQP